MTFCALFCRRHQHTCLLRILRFPAFVLGDGCRNRTDCEVSLHGFAGRSRTMRVIRLSTQTAFSFRLYPLPIPCLLPTSRRFLQLPSSRLDADDAQSYRLHRPVPSPCPQLAGIPFRIRFSQARLVPAVRSLIVLFDIPVSSLPYRYLILIIFLPKRRAPQILSSLRGSSGLF